jgi:hypothetical protein
MDGKASLACENGSVEFHGIDVEGYPWEYDREHPYGRGGLVCYTKEKCRKFAKSTLQAKSNEACQEGPFSPILRHMDDASARDYLFVRLYWKQSN